MKKLLKVFTTLTMAASLTTVTTLAVACEGAYSKQINNILDLDRENFFNLPEFNYNLMCAPTYYMGKNNDLECGQSTEEESVPSADGTIDTYFSTSYEIQKYIPTFDDAKNYNISFYFGKAAIELYQASASWFDNLIVNDQEDWAKIVYEDIVNGYDQDTNIYQSPWFINGAGATEVRHITSDLGSKARRSLLTFLGDTVTTLDFQRSVARFAVLRKNLNLLYEGYQQAQVLYDQAKDEGETGDKLLELGVFISDLKIVLAGVSEGKFIPLLKLVSSGTARSLGNSQVSIKFDTNLVDYVNVGNMSQSNILAYYNKFSNKTSGSGENQIVYTQPTTQDIIRFASTYDKNMSASGSIERYIADFNQRNLGQLFLYGYEYKRIVEKTLGN